MRIDYQDYVKNGAWKGYPIRPRPVLNKEERQRFAFFAHFMAIIVSLVVGYWLGQLVICFILANIAAIWLYAKIYPLRCPKCEGHVISRNVDDEDEPENYYYWYNDCPNCEISWQSKRYVKPCN